MMRHIDAVRRAWLRLFGVRTHTIETEQGRLRFLEVQGTGTLPPVMLIHGLSSCSVDWGQVILRLRKQCQRVRAVDLPGHGLSDTPKDGMGEAAMREMLTAAGETLLDVPHILVGNSLGGLVSVRIAGQRPEITLALALISPAGTPVPKEDLKATLDGFRIDTWAKAQDFVADCMGTGSRRRFDLAWGIRARVSRPSVQALVDAFSFDHLLGPEELQTLEMPIFLYWGQDDKILGPDHLDFYRTHLPEHAECHTPARMGHAPFLNSARRFVEPVLEFCARVPVGDAEEA